MILAAVSAEAICLLVGCYFLLWTRNQDCDTVLVFSRTFIYNLFLSDPAVSVSGSAGFLLLYLRVFSAWFVEI